MSITLSPAKARYLEQVRSQLSDLPDEEREEIVQDLVAHLAELDDGRIETELGEPEAFAAEFRSSAGYDEPASRQVWEALPRFWNWLESNAHRIGQLVRWPSIRPVWIWIRRSACGLRLGSALYRGVVPTLSDTSDRKQHVGWIVLGCRCHGDLGLAGPAPTDPVAPVWDSNVLVRRRMGVACDARQPFVCEH